MKTTNHLEEFASDALGFMELPEIVGGIENIENLDDPDDRLQITTDFVEKQ